MNVKIKTIGFKNIFYGMLILGLILALIGSASACLTHTVSGGAYGSAAVCVSGNTLNAAGTYVPDGNQTCGGGSITACIMPSVDNVTIDCIDPGNSSNNLNGGGFDSNGIKDPNGFTINNVTVKNCNIHNFNNFGILLGGGENHQITGNVIHNNYGGIDFNRVNGGVNSSRINNNTVENNINDGIFIDAPSTVNEFNLNRICGNGAEDIDNDGNITSGGNTCGSGTGYKDALAPPELICVDICAGQNIANVRINLIDPPAETPLCANKTTAITANVTINATNPYDRLLENVSACINVTCDGGFVFNGVQYLNLSRKLYAPVVFNVTPTAVGKCNVTACVDCENKISENNEYDNCGNTTFSVRDCSPKHSVPISPLAALAIMGVLTAISISRIRK